MTDLRVATFYHFAKLENYEDMKPLIKDVCKKNEIKGTILIAEEGINSTIAGQRANLENLFAFLKKDPRLKNLTWKESRGNFMPFQRLKVRLKKEIVRLANDDLETMQQDESGEYVEPIDWADFIKREDVKIIDIRNSYETKIGKFKNAIDPDTLNFREFTTWAQNWTENEKIKKDQKIAMYCTGGIRCEKSTAYMKMLGFKNVYHLKGGILEYLKQTKNKQNAWQGSCFVFDDRVALDENLNQVSLYCFDCKKLMTTDDLQDVTAKKLVCIKCEGKKND